MLLMEEAERIALEEHGSFKIGVISGQSCFVSLPFEVCLFVALAMCVTLKLWSCCGYAFVDVSKLCWKCWAI